MNESIICKRSPAKTLAVTAASLRELLNFLVYRQNPEILNERARRQPIVSLANIPQNIPQLGAVLQAEKCENGRKLYFDCADSRNHRSILVHNFNAQFWVHYFRCGVGLVSVTCFSELASAEGSVIPTMTRTVADSYEYQWFTHNLEEKFFQKGKPEIYLNKLARYFLEQVNPNLVSPYAVFSEPKQSMEQYKFVQGSLEKLKEILKQAIFVCEAIKRGKDRDGKCYVSPYLIVTCGSLRYLPQIEHSSELFLNQIGTLVIRENVPFTILNESHYRRVDPIFSDWMRKNRHRIYLNFDEEIRNATPREKIAAKSHLLNWLKKQGREGLRIIENWKLENGKKVYFDA
jgi:hypothetical protein